MLQHSAKGTAAQAQKLATRSDSSSDFGIDTSLKDGGEKLQDSLPHVGIGTFARTCNHIIAAFLSVIGFNIASVRSIPDICQFFGSTAQFRPVKRAPNVHKFETK